MIHVETSSGLFPVVDETGELRLHARTHTHARRIEGVAENGNGGTEWLYRDAGT